MWKIQHPGGQREINELHVPVDRNVRLFIQSQDVIHSFYVPAFRIKRDAVPGCTTTAWFRPTRVGQYHLFCAEYCGTEHSRMTGVIHVMARADYERWLSGAAPEQPAPIPGTPGTPGATMRAAGEGVYFRLGCNSCHVPEFMVRVPRLEGSYGHTTELHNGQSIVADEAYLRESILDPNAKIVAGYTAPSLMPTYRGQVTEEELNELVEYLKSLTPGTETQP